MNSPARRTVSLAYAVTMQSALATAGAMAIYAVAQYFTTSGHTVWGLLLEHGWHVLALGALTYVVIYLTTHRQVVMPIRDLYLKCYAVTRGDLTPIALTSRINEIREIAHGINLIVLRVPHDPSSTTLEQLSLEGRHLRHIVEHEGDQLTLVSRAYLLDLAKRLEHETAAS